MSVTKNHEIAEISCR